MCSALMCVDVAVQSIETQNGGERHSLELDAAGVL